MVIVRVSTNLFLSTSSVDVPAHRALLCDCAGRPHAIVARHNCAIQILSKTIPVEKNYIMAHPLT